MKELRLPMLLSLFLLGVALSMCIESSLADHGSSVEGDSSMVTYTHSVAADSAHALFSFGEAAAYDSALLYPLAGAANRLMIADDKIDLDSVGTHFVMIEVYDGGAIVDTSVGTWYHEDYAGLYDTLTDVHDDLYVLMAYFAACDGCYMRMYPEDGSANKDSTVMIDPSKGTDSLVGKVLWLHSNQSNVYDSSYFYYDDPW